ncbi:MAG: hypothetical protein M0R03_20995 [Novosphingobium sp.]|nr:hypothetical protein [Novosphingobium sp.]
MNLREELTKTEVKKIIKDELKLKETEKMIKKIIADSFEEFHKTMWVKRSFWKNDLKN